jgi:glyoxylase-like metal-dependent hydrolase (beta-lactamase superfamily II)
MQQIERGIHYENSYMGVTLGALIFSHGVIIIDTPLKSEDVRSWRSTLINQRGGSNRLLINLDAHPDRTLGTRALECTIVAHQKTAQVFRNRPIVFKGQSAETGAVWETYSEAIGMRWAPPDITFSERMSLQWGGPEVILEHQPGPTPGSIWVVIPTAGVIFVGDTIVLNQPPFLSQANLEAWLQSLDSLNKLYRDFVIVSGRGGPVSLDDIRKQSVFIKGIIDKMEKSAAKNALPEVTRDWVPSLLSNFSSPQKLQELYSTRLRYGLHQCFARRYHPSSLIGQSESGIEEQ